MTWFQIVNYLKYRRRAKNEHSLHSPFMFETYLQCIKGKKDDDIIKALSQRYEVCELQDEVCRLRCEQTAVYFLRKPYRNEQSLRCWQRLCRQNGVVLDIDLYSIGLIVVKSGLKRQSYVLKP